VQRRATVRVLYPLCVAPHARALYSRRSWQRSWLFSRVKPAGRWSDGSRCSYALRRPEPRRHCVEQGLLWRGVSFGGIPMCRHQGLWCALCIAQGRWRNCRMRHGHVRSWRKLTCERSGGIRVSTRTGSRALLFDHLVGNREQGRRHLEAQRLGGLEMEHELEFGGLNHWKIGGLGALED
jgi:hypothetical protein